MKQVRFHHEAEVELFYVEEDTDIWIVAVAHQKRKPDYWLGRVSDI